VIHTLLTIVLGPVLLIQGWRTSRRVPLLPEPSGPRRGTSGEGPLLRLLIVGDSAGAGVGAEHQDDALLGQLVQRLAHHYRVEWRLEAETGATTASTIERLEAFEPFKADVVLTSLGVNDVTHRVGKRTWRRQQREVRDLVRSRFGAAHLIVGGLPPVHLFPALPQPLRWYLGRRCTEFDRDLQRQLPSEHDADYVDARWSTDRSLMASDGFHPGPGVYAEWARRAATLIEQRREIGRRTI
jgi:lysophospholipase L1-like esterase